MALFTADRSIHFNYHGLRYGGLECPTVWGVRIHYKESASRAYDEEGSTTAPFDMMLLRNRVSRYHVVEAAIEGAARKYQKSHCPYCKTPISCRYSRPIDKVVRLLLS